MNDPLGKVLTRTTTAKPTAPLAATARPTKLRPIRSLQELRAAPATEDLVFRVARAARSEGYQARGEQLLQEVFEQGIDGLTAARWATSRLRSGVSASTLAQDVSAARRAAMGHDQRYQTALNDQLLKDVVTASRRLEGPAPLIKGATPMLREEYDALLSRGPLRCRQMLALCWLRAARAADIIAMKEGSLWMADGLLHIELGQEKVRKLGIPGFMVVPLPLRERVILAPLIARHPPSTPPFSRRPLLPVTYQDFYGYITTHRPTGSNITPHSLRKGAVVRMLDAGKPLRDIALVTQHRSTCGLMSYIPKLDRETRQRMTSASASIVGGIT